VAYPQKKIIQWPTPLDGVVEFLFVVGCKVFYTDRTDRTGGVRYRFTGPVRSGRKPVETGQIRISNQNAQFKWFPPVYRPVPGRLTKKRISGEFDVFSNLN
jgi:hypothetical protein